MHEDVMALTPNAECKFRRYEMSRLSWVKSELLQALERWKEDKHEVQGEDVAFGNELKDSVTIITDTVEEKFGDITTTPREELWELYTILLTKVEQTLICIKELNLPPVKPDILKATDAGPGVGSSNVEVKYRDVEMARIFNSNRVNRIHRARDDSGQNEAERSNACIGEALVDGGAMKWQYYEAFEGLTQEEIQALSLADIKKREELAMEQNAWRVAKDVAERINHESGPAGDFMQSYLTPQKHAQFFFNTEHLRQYVSSTESNQKGIPGCAYFKKISVCLKDHVQVGELYLEYLKGACLETNGSLCEFCKKFPCSIQDLKRVPRPLPDETALPHLCYLPYDKTPTISSNGSPRDVDDFQPRAQMKKRFADGTIALDNVDSITTFSKTFAVDESLVRKYLEHLDYLALKKAKRAEERKKKKEDELHKTYSDYNWVELFHKGALGKLTVPVLNLFLAKHNLVRHKMNKKEKIEMISAWLANSEFNRIQQQDTKDDSDDSSINDVSTDDSSDDNSDGEAVADFSHNLDDIVLHEIGYSSDNEQSDGQVYEQLPAPYISTRSGRTVTTHLTRRFFGDSD